MIRHTEAIRVAPLHLKVTWLSCRVYGLFGLFRVSRLFAFLGSIVVRFIKVIIMPHVHFTSSTYNRNQVAESC